MDNSRPGVDRSAADALDPARSTARSTAHSPTREQPALSLNRMAMGSLLMHSTMGSGFVMTASIDSDDTVLQDGFQVSHMLALCFAWGCEGLTAATEIDCRGLVPCCAIGRWDVDFQNRPLNLGAT